MSKQNIKEEYVDYEVINRFFKLRITHLILIPLILI